MTTSPSQFSFSSQSSLYSDDDQQQQNGMFFDDIFDMSIFLFKGHFGDTYRCIERDSGNKYAVKIINPVGSQYLNHNHCVTQFTREGAIWRRLKHRNIVDLFRIFSATREQFLVTEYIKDGKLFDQLPHYVAYTEQEACYFTRQLLEALSYLRRKRVVHRNITAESILIEQNDHHGEVLKLCEFNLALRLERGQRYIKTEAKGAPLYMAPEVVLQQPINYGVDSWAVGVILYTLLVGIPPFWNERLEMLYAEALTKPIDVSSHLWNSVSSEAKDMLHCLLDKDQNARITPDNALNHAWMSQHCDVPRSHRPRTIEALKEFNSCRRARGNIFMIQTVLSRDKKRVSGDPNNNKESESIINSFGQMRRQKLFEEERKTHVSNHVNKSTEVHVAKHNGGGTARRMMVVSKTKTIDLCTKTNKAKVCVHFQPKKLYVNLNTT